MGAFSMAEDALRKHLKGTRLEAPARAVVEWRRPTWRQDRLDNDRLRLLIDYTFREDSCGVDVGAHQGVFLREMARVAPNGHHAAFEALPELAEALTIEFSESAVYSAAVGETAGTMTFMRNKSTLAQSGMAGRREQGDQDLEPIEVPVVTLDDVLIHPPTLIKIDVEGAEGYVLRGAKATLSRHRPIVWLEHGAVASRECGIESAEIFSIFSGAGMRIFDVNGYGPYTLSEFESPPPMVWTFVAR
jgi:FkbM family methyltransferase